MSLRKFMHPRNKYKTPPDFKELADIYPEFRENIIVDLSGKVRYNFSNEESLRILTKTLLKHDFNLDVTIPLEKLVPALPLRLNYVLWIDDLMKHGSLVEISGIDIGTGAIGIYLLLCASMFKWKMIGTDIDDSTVESAKDIIHKNQLDHLINVLMVDSKSIIKDALAANTYSFSMCNPPFFDVDDINKKKKRTPPHNASTGNEAELSITGGEKSFFTNMVDESIELQDKVKIYTTMLGQKNSLAFCKSELKKRNIKNTTWTEFCQGHTKRWGLAWSFLPRDQLDLPTAPTIRTRALSSQNKSKDQNMVELKFPTNDKYKSIADMINSLKEWINELKIEIKESKLEDDDLNCCWACHLRAESDTWTHARRKRRMTMQLAQSDSKKLRLNEENTEDSVESCEKDYKETTNKEAGNSSQNYLEFTLGIGELNEDTDEDVDKESNSNIKICMIYHDGEGGKNGLESFKQYLINKFGIREYFQQRNKEIGCSPKKKKKKKKKESSG